MQRIIVASFIFFGLALGTASAAMHKYTAPGKSMHHHQKHRVAKYQKPSAPKYKKPH
jgi:hypothetical protein